MVTLLLLPSRDEVCISTSWLGLVICFRQWDNSECNRSRGLKAVCWSLPSLMALEFWNHYVKQLELLADEKLHGAETSDSSRALPPPKTSRLPTASHMNEAFLDCPAPVKPPAGSRDQPTWPGPEAHKVNLYIMRNNKWLLFEAYFEFWADC